MEHIKRRRNKSTSFPLSILGGILGGFMIGILLVFLFSFIVFGGEDPTAHLAIWGLLALGFSVLSCGYLAAKLWKHSTFIPSLLAGGIYTVMIVGIGLCIPGTALTLPMRIWSVPVMLLLSILGGGLAGKKRRHRRPR